MASALQAKGVAIAGSTVADAVELRRQIRAAGAAAGRSVTVQLAVEDAP